MAFNPAMGKESDPCGWQEGESESDEKPEIRVSGPRGYQDFRPWSCSTCSDHSEDALLLPAGLSDHGRELVPFIGDDGQDCAELDRNLSAGRDLSIESQGMADKN
jgi:hypothetical protein